MVKSLVGNSSFNWMQWNSFLSPMGWVEWKIKWRP